MLCNGAVGRPRKQLLRVAHSKHSLRVRKQSATNAHELCCKGVKCDCLVFGLFQDHILMHVIPLQGRLCCRQALACGLACTSARAV